MENASKALLIAGGVLIAILVASLGVYFSRTIAENVAVYYQKMEDNKRTEFNQQFLNFNDSMKQKEDGTWVATSINMQDVVTIINLAKDSNRENDLEDSDAPSIPLNDNSFYVTVRFIGTDGSQPGIGEYTIDQCENLEQFNYENIDSAITYEMKKEVIRYFNCKVYVSNSTGYVNYIEIFN